MINIIEYKNQSATELFGVREDVTGNVEESVKQIIADVRTNGDSAIKKYSAKFDGFSGESLLVTDEEYAQAFAE